MTEHPWGPVRNPPCARLEHLQAQRKCELDVPAKCHICKNRLGFTAKMNLVCPPSARFTRIAWDTQRKYKLDEPVKRHICKNLLGFPGKIRNGCASKCCKLQESFGIPSENTNWMSPSSAIYARISWDTQRKSENGCASKGCKLQESLGTPSENTN